MKRTIKIIQIFILALVGLGTYDLMTTYDLNAAGRYQYGGLELGYALRKLADIIVLVALLIVIIRKWNEKSINLIFIVFSSLFIFIILLDCWVWLFVMDSNDIYYIILGIHSIALIIVARDLLQFFSFEPVKLIYIGLLVLLIGFGFDILFIGIPYQDAPIELFDRMMFYEQIKRLIYYLGAVVISIGIINKMKGKASLLIYRRFLIIGLMFF